MVLDQVRPRLGEVGEEVASLGRDEPLGEFPGGPGGERVGSAESDVELVGPIRNLAMKLG